MSKSSQVDISDILKKALEKRSVFHSEADFQHHLAWVIHKQTSLETIRLEMPLSLNSVENKQYCDIVIGDNSNKIGIELKYKTKKDKFEIVDEKFDLKQQGAQNLARYDFCKDIWRLEQWCSDKVIQKGYAIFLTDDDTYYENKSRKETLDEQFKIHKNQKIEGELKWKDGISEKTKKKRPNFYLTGSYKANWEDAPHNAELNHQFKYLLIEVTLK